MNDAFYYSTFASPVGKLFILANDRFITGLYFEHSKALEYVQKAEAMEPYDHLVLEDTKQQLTEYFSGRRKVFDLPLKPQGTVFQLKAWKQLQAIPYGKTIAYGEQAARVGDIKKARAVGIANGRNPISIIVPCHRVIGADGSLTGYGGGLKTKQFLLDLEKKFAA